MTCRADIIGDASFPGGAPPPVSASFMLFPIGTGANIMEYRQITQGGTSMIYFNSDYCEGAHPRVLDKLVKTNLEQSSGYGTDAYLPEGGGPHPG